MGGSCLRISSRSWLPRAPPRTVGWLSTGRIEARALLGGRGSHSRCSHRRGRIPQTRPTTNEKCRRTIPLVQHDPANKTGDRSPVPGDGYVRNRAAVPPLHALEAPVSGPKVPGSRGTHCNSLNTCCMDAHAEIFMAPRQRTGSPERTIRTGLRRPSLVRGRYARASIPAR